MICGLISGDLAAVGGSSECKKRLCLLGESAGVFEPLLVKGWSGGEPSASGKGEEEAEVTVSRRGERVGGE